MNNDTKKQNDYDKLVSKPLSEVNELAKRSILSVFGVYFVKR